MNAKNGVKVAATAALGLALLAPSVAPFTPSAQARSAFADPAMEVVWDRTDKPIEDRVAARSWMWGPDTFYSSYEPYHQGPGGQHLVSYFDKSRMEINNPTADRNSQWFVTNGLLVVDMIAGQIQQGDAQFVPASPANIPVAGDQGGSPETPTYASLARYASLKGDNRAPNRTGQPVKEGIGRTGGIGTLDNLAGFAKYGVYEPTTGHNIADVFWSFINQRGTVYENGRYTNGTVVDWLFAMGYPITEPYWIKIKVHNEERWVLMQAFQRRILTYSPYNPEGWKVEMGNVGRAYFDWRYKQPAPTPTPQPTASIALNALSGDFTAPITVTGKLFPAFAAVTLGVEKSTVGYYREVQTVGVKQDGTFTARITLPADAATLGRINIAATANGGAVKATQPYVIAALLTEAPEVITGRHLDVRGYGFPPSDGNVRVGIQLNGSSHIEWLVRTTSKATGEIEAEIPVGNRPAGTLFKVVAEANNGFRVYSRDVRVIAQPTLEVVPNRGPAGVNVTLRGTNWPANRDVRIGRKPVESKEELWLPNPVRTDAAGNFQLTVFVGPEYARKTEARLFAQDPVSTVRLDVVYTVTR